MKLKILVLIIALLALASCNSLENDSTSGTMLQIVSITGEGDTLPLFSSVAINENDIGVLKVNALAINPSALTDETSPYMDVLIDQIDVEFKRTDGRNVEGVDVPYRFTQPLSYLVTINGQASIPFMLIRHVAKLEAPLLALREFFNQGKILELVAIVTIHGKDLGGHRVAPVTGYLSVWCSNAFETDSTEN